MWYKLRNNYIDFVKCSLNGWLMKLTYFPLKLLVPDGCKLTTWLSHDLNTKWTQKGHKLDNRWSRVLIVLKANWYVVILLCICRYNPCKMQLSSISSIYIATDMCICFGRATSCRSICWLAPGIWPVKVLLPYPLPLLPCYLSSSFTILNLS